MKPPAGVPWGLLLLCAMLPWTSGNANQEKAGSCPTVDRATCKDVPPALAECQRDSQCPGSERCCCHNCTKTCTETVTVHRGFCPKSRGNISMVCTKEMLECIVDSNCTADEKCCHVSPCTTKCVKAVAENPGYCPIDPDLENQCGLLSPPRCISDAECAANEKCCLFGCGMQCVKALPGRFDSCPNYPDKIDMDCAKEAVECTNDSNCTADDKCCHVPPCTTKCVKAVADHDGFCPSHNPVTCTGKPILDCSHDSACPAYQKCCDVGCRKKCVKSIKGKQGMCRSAPARVTASDKCNKCNEDKDCPKDEKCCSGDQGRECQKPHTSSIMVKPGECPVPFAVCSYPPPYHHNCNHDGECSRDKKCCVDLCGRDCFPPAPVEGKPGTCPAPYLKCLEWTDICEDDSQCPGSKKCCFSYCERTCVVPITAHLGVCPTIVNPFPRYSTTCQDDRDCYEYDRCCTFPQGAMCVLPVPEDTSL